MPLEARKEVTLRCYATKDERWEITNMKPDRIEWENEYTVKDDFSSAQCLAATIKHTLELLDSLINQLSLVALDSIAYRCLLVAESTL